MRAEMNTGTSFGAGGYQPYAKTGGQMPGPALLAMLRGAPAHMANPMALQRYTAAQAARPGARPLSLLDLLLRAG